LLAHSLAEVHCESVRKMFSILSLMAIVPVTGQVPILPQPLWGRSTTKATGHRANDHGRVSPPPTGAESAAALPPFSAAARSGLPCARPGEWRHGRGADGRSPLAGPWGEEPFALSPPPALTGDGDAAAAAAPSRAPRPQPPGRGGVAGRLLLGAGRLQEAYERVFLAGRWGRQLSFLLVAPPPSHGGRWPSSTLPRAATPVAARPFVWCLFGLTFGAWRPCSSFSHDLAAYERPHVTRTNPLWYYSVGPG